MTPDTAALRPRSRDLKPRDVLVWTGTPRPTDLAKVIHSRKDDDTGWWMTDGSGLADYVWDNGGAWTTVRALCDAADEVERLTSKYEEWESMHSACIALREDVARHEREAVVLNESIGRHRRDLDAAGESLRRVAAERDAARAEVERRLPCDAGCTEYPEEECSRHGRPVSEVWQMLTEAVAANTASRTAHAALGADLRALHTTWRRGDSMVSRDHAAVLGQLLDRHAALLDRHAPEEGS